MSRSHARWPWTLQTGRRLVCTHCSTPVWVHEIPEHYLDPASFECGDCRETTRLEEFADREAETRRDSMFQIPQRAQQ